MDLECSNLGEIVEKAVNKYDCIGSIYSTTKSEGITEALKKCNKTHIKVISNDFSPQTKKDVLDGIVDCIIFHSPASASYLAVQSMHSILVEKNVLKNINIETYTQIIIRENIANYK